MDTIDRITAICQYAQQQKNNEAIAEREKLERIEKYKNQILQNRDRIQKLILTARACLDNGISLCNESPNYRSYSDGHFVTDGWAHNVGFLIERDRNNRSLTYINKIGKEGGGACHYDVFTDGDTVEASGRDAEYALKAIVDGFDKFESKFYEYVDKICQSR